jgi:hypothetical protein
MKPHPVLLGELLRRQGAEVLYMAITGGGHGFRIALRRCGRCPAFERCREFLASGAREGYEEFCPIAGLVHRAKALAS